LNSFPSTIDLRKYSDPYSGDNPIGDYMAAYRFRNLCNQIPTFTRCFNVSGNSVEGVWKDIVFGAEATNQYSRGLLTEAQHQFQKYTLSNMAGIADPWLPVEAVPSNWFDLVSDAPELVLDFTKPIFASNYLLIKGADPLVWRASGPGNNNQNTPLKGKVENITVKALKVDLLRNWLDFQILSIGGWNVAGMTSGFYSSGDPVENDGLFPLLPTAVIVGVDVTIRGNWAVEDEDIVDAHLKRGEPLSLGPFPLVRAGQPVGIDSTGAIRSQVGHVVGYLSALVPYAPLDTNLKPGSVLIRNEGAFIARFSVQWRNGGVREGAQSGSFPVLSAKSIDLPSAARDIEVTIEILTFPKPMETWRTVATYQFPSPVQKSFQLSGTTFGPKIAMAEDGYG
jgi:hypothetical protein